MRDDTPHVFHLITRLLHGGAEETVVQITANLDGYRFTVGHGAAYEPDQVSDLRDSDVDTRKFQLIRHYNPVVAPIAIVSVARYLRSADVDLVHTHSTEAGIIGRAAAAIAGKPVIHTVHGIPFSDDRSPLLNRFVLACERAVAPVTDRIVTNADAMAHQYLGRNIGRPRQYQTVYNGIDLEPFRRAEPTSDLPGRRPRVLMVGRLADGKGFEVLLDALERLDSQSFSVAIAGDGPLRDSLKSRIQSRELGDCVFLLGYRDDIPDVMAASDVLVLPSFREGTPRVITEAMASGLPVVATDIAGIPEQVDHGETGFLIPTGDPTALSEHLGRLLEDPGLREDLGATGRARSGRFALDTMLTDLDALYAEVLDETYRI